ncbi:MAG TPA: hypothetical protein VGA73_10190 [Candidatus Binatia bacterium]
MRKRAGKVKAGKPSAAGFRGAPNRNLARAALAAPPARDHADLAEMLAELRGLFAELKNRRQRAFLAAYARTMAIKKAARFARVSSKSHYRWLRRDPIYRQCFHHARQILGDAAEEEVWRRAYEGYDTPILYGGAVTGWYKSYSDTLAMFMLKGLKPEVYRDRDYGAGPFEGPTSITIRVVGERREGAPPIPTEPIVLRLPGSKASGR